MTRNTQTNTNSSRRTFLKAAGAGSALVLAGCVGGENAEEQPEEPQEPQEDDGLPPAESLDTDRIAADPTDVPDPVDWDEPRRHEITMKTTEEVAEIEPGVTFHYMTFDGQVPGPMIRVREGDTIYFTLEVPEDLNMDMHNIDFHATYGPGGGAADTTIGPGESATIEFKVMYPGVHIYHCTVPQMDHHISAGMFGAILVEPEDGLPEVDRELYFGQHELYTEGTAGEEGHHRFDFGRMRNEDPTYVVLNGEAYAFTENGRGPIPAEKGETVRVFFANGGPNLTSAVHPIGNVMSRYYRDGDVLSEPDRNIETAPVSPGAVTMWEMETPVPGPIKIVDHALSRVVRKGMLGVIDVQGEPEPDIYNPNP